MSKLILKNVKVGDRLRMANDMYAQNGYSKDEVVIVTLKQGSYVYVNKPDMTGQQIAVTINNLIPAVMTKADLDKSIKSLEVEIASHKDKLEWMELTGNDEYDETEVKVWKTLKTLNSKSTDAEKAKVIAKLING